VKTNAPKYLFCDLLFLFGSTTHGHRQRSSRFVPFAFVDVHQDIKIRNVFEFGIVSLTFILERYDLSPPAPYSGDSLTESLERMVKIFVVFFEEIAVPSRID
jgi:hypothetical protein